MATEQAGERVRERDRERESSASARAIFIPDISGVQTKTILC